MDQAAITLEQARLHLNAWLAADLKVATGQSYSIEGRMLTRANASEIRKNIAHWKAEVDRLEAGRRGRNRIYRVIQRDF